jgi:hypothetical protein
MEVKRMRVTLETRKPVDHLTVSDLSTFPVWEFALDEEGVEGRDETWVRPLNAQIVPKNMYSLQVAADFRAACGRTYSGFVDVTTANPKWASGPVDITVGVILHGTNYLPIPAPKGSFFQKARESLGLSDSELFPITYTLRALIEGEQALRTGVINQPV